MSKYLIGAMVMLLLSGCNLFSGAKSELPSGGQEQESKPFSGTLKAAIDLGVPLKCTSQVESEEGQGSVSGIIQNNQYVGQIEVDGKMGNILMKDNCMWTWQEGATSGMKTCFEVQEGESAWGEFDSEQMNQSVNCVPTIIAPGTFSPPGNVNFLDMDELMDGELSEDQIKQLQEMGGEAE